MYLYVYNIYKENIYIKNIYIYTQSIFSIWYYADFVFNFLEMDATLFLNVRLIAIFFSHII